MAICVEEGSVLVMIFELDGKHNKRAATNKQQQRSRTWPHRQPRNPKPETRVVKSKTQNYGTKTQAI
jgi:hypothetical protein